MSDMIIKNNTNNKLFNKLKDKLNMPISTLQVLIIFFFIYSIIGWCLESIYCIYELGHFEKRGFLYGPLCPIYGYGALILLVLLQPFSKNRFTIFVSSAIILSILEYLVGYGIDALFSMKFWDYSNNWLNINGRITLWFTVIWGVFGVLFLEFTHPIIKKFTNWCLKKIDGGIQHIIIYLALIIYVVDTFASIIKYII